MRLILFSILIFSLLNCKGKKSTTNFNKLSENQIFNLDKCAVDTQCSIEIIPNAELAVKEGEQQDYNINLEDGDKIVVKYMFKRNELPNTADSNYSELLYFEIDKNEEQLSLVNEDLQNVKMTYGRFCYCKDGTSGYFKVTQGNLKLIKSNNELSIDLNFNVGKIPQLLTTIKETVKLK
ncbi:hypothetical protein [Aureibaculum conchae]|uniref:hypothetical protein n=1 Tax=Aureibaculum sp. 2308TA14-22 TaxID=3108392 RepID=UPI0033964701